MVLRVSAGVGGVVGLFVAEGNGRVKPSGAAGRDAGSGQRHRRKKGGNGSQREGIGCGDTEQQVAEKTCDRQSEGEADEDAKGGHFRAVKQNGAEDAGVCGAEGDANANLAGALADDV